MLTEGEAAEAMDLCTRMLASRFDSRHGGFGGAPKFPRPAEINALLHQHLRVAALGKKEDASKLFVTMLVVSMQVGQCNLPSIIPIQLSWAGRRMHVVGDRQHEPISLHT